MGHKTLEYAAGTRQRRPFSRLAVAALPIALLGFPLFPHWVFEQELHDACKAWQLDRDAVLRALLVVWPTLCLLPSVVALIRLRIRGYSHRGRRLALAGIMVSLLWLLMLGVIALFQRPGPMGPL